MEIVLESEDFALKIVPQEPLTNWFSGKVCLSSPILGKNFLLETDIYCPFEDWLQLCEIVEKHIQKLTANVDNISFVTSQTWQPTDMTLNFTCLAGEADSENGEIQGGFDVRIMIKIYGENSDSFVFSGLEGQVEITEALAFCKALREYVASQSLAGING